MRNATHFSANSPVAQWRGNLGMTVEKAAHLARLTPERWTDLETGVATPTDDEMGTVANVLGHDAVDLALAFTLHPAPATAAETWFDQRIAYSRLCRCLSASRPDEAAA